MMAEAAIDQQIHLALDKVVQARRLQFQLDALGCFDPEGRIKHRRGSGAGVQARTTIVSAIRSCTHWRASPKMNKASIRP